MAYNKNGGWYGIDLDGSLAFYDGTQTGTEIGPPIKPMVDRVKRWLEEGREVRIFTARMSPRTGGSPGHIEEVRAAIEAWCIEHIGTKLEVTNMKDHGLIELWDDRAVGLIFNTGIPVVEGHP